MAVKGFGTLLKHSTDGTAAYTTLAEVTEISGPTMEVGTVETTHLSSTTREFLPTIPDGGEITFDIEYDSDDTSHQILTGLMTTPAIAYWQVVMSDGTAANFSFAGILTGFEPGGFTVDDVVTASCSIKVTGDVTVA